jgi:hypothetical protein
MKNGSRANRIAFVLVVLWLLWLLVSIIRGSLYPGSVHQ